MSVQHANSGVVRDGLVLYYDIKSVNSFRGEATTNIITQTSFANWSLSNEATRTPFVRAFDYNYAYKILEVSTSLFGFISTSSLSAITSGLEYTLSVWFVVNPEATSRCHFRFRGVVGGITRFLSLRLYNDTGAVDIGRNDLKGVVGDLAATVASHGISETRVYNGYTWKRAYITFTMPSGLSSTQVELLPAHDSLSNVASAANTGYTIAWGPQLEQKDYPTPFVNGTRTNLATGGGGFLDLSKISKADANTDTIEYDASGPYVSSLNKYVFFGGTNPSLQNLTDDGNSHTFECWWMPLGTPPGANDGYFCGRRGTHNGHRHLKSNGLQHRGLLWYVSGSTNVAANVGSTYTYPSYGTWGHLCYVVDEPNNIARYYVNGNQQGSNFSVPLNPITGTPWPLRSYGTRDYHLFSGGDTPNLTANNWSGNGRLGVVRFYNKALSASEVLKNYNAQKYLYGH